MKSQNSEVEVEGELGYFNLRGKPRGSLEDQLSKVGSILKHIYD